MFWKVSLYDTRFWNFTAGKSLLTQAATTGLDSLARCLLWGTPSGSVPGPDYSALNLNCLKRILKNKHFFGINKRQRDKLPSPVDRKLIM